MRLSHRHGLWAMSSFVLLLLIIEFLDELVFGAREAALPLIQQDLDISYGQIGLLLMLPAFLANFIEPVFAIWADMGRKRWVILGSGLLFTGGLILTALSGNYLILLGAMIILYPASGGFVSISQAAMIDSEPARAEQNMARWTFFGSLGVVAGPLLFTATLSFGYDWRVMFAFLAVFAFVLVIVGWMMPKHHFNNHSNQGKTEGEESLTFVGALKTAWGAIKQRSVLRWLILLEISDMMLDILHGFKALYLVNIVGVTFEQSALVLSIATIVGLIGDFLLIYILERVQGLRYLRFAVIAILILYPLMLLVENTTIKIGLLIFMTLFLAGWYPILMGNLYASLPGKSGTVLVTANFANIFGSLIPLGLGLVADRFGLNITMWLILLSPILLLVLLPRSDNQDDEQHK